MIRINLLPWREAERARNKRNFVVNAVTAVALTGFLGVAGHLYIEALISYQDARNAFLTQAIKQLDQQIKEIKDLEDTKARLIARMSVIQQLQGSRPEAVHLMDELVNTLPDGVYLTSVQQGGRSIALKGRAQSNARVSGLMRNIDASSWIESPNLTVVENKERTSTGLNHFEVRLQQKAAKPSGAQQGS